MLDNKVWGKVLDQNAKHIAQRFTKYYALRIEAGEISLAKENKRLIPRAQRIADIQQRLQDDEKTWTGYSKASGEATKKPTLLMLQAQAMGTLPAMPETKPLAIMPAAPDSSLTHRSAPFFPVAAVFPGSRPLPLPPQNRAKALASVKNTQLPAEDNSNHIAPG